MKNEGPKAFSFKPQEISMVDDFEGGAGFMNAVMAEDGEIGEMSPPLVFMLLSTRPLGSSPEEVRLVITPSQALEMAAMLAEMGLTALAMPKGADLVDIVDRV